MDVLFGVRIVLSELQFMLTKAIQISPAYGIAAKHKHLNNSRTA